MVDRELDDQLLPSQHLGSADQDACDVLLVIAPDFLLAGVYQLIQRSHGRVEGATAEGVDDSEGEGGDAAKHGLGEPAGPGEMPDEALIDLLSVRLCQPAVEGLDRLPDDGRVDGGLYAG